MVPPACPHPPIVTCERISYQSWLTERDPLICEFFIPASWNGNHGEAE